MTLDLIAKAGGGSLSVGCHSWNAELTCLLGDDSGKKDGNKVR